MNANGNGNVIAAREAELEAIWKDQDAYKEYDATSTPIFRRALKFERVITQAQARARKVVDRALECYEAELAAAGALRCRDIDQFLRRRLSSLIRQGALRRRPESLGLYEKAKGRALDGSSLPESLVGCRKKALEGLPPHERPVSETFSARRYLTLGWLRESRTKLHSRAK